MTAKRMIFRTWKNRKDLSVVRVLADLARQAHMKRLLGGQKINSLFKEHGKSQ